MSNADLVILFPRSGKMHENNNCELDEFLVICKIVVILGGELGNPKYI